LQKFSKTLRHSLNCSESREAEEEELQLEFEDDSVTSTRDDETPIETTGVVGAKERGTIFEISGLLCCSTREQIWDEVMVEVCWQRSLMNCLGTQRGLAVVPQSA